MTIPFKARQIPIKVPARVSTNVDNARIYEFGPFRLEPAEPQLLRAGRLAALTPKAFETLHALVAGGGRAVSKDDLMRAVWPDTNVSDATLSQNIFALRKALGINIG